MAFEAGTGSGCLDYHRYFNVIRQPYQTDSYVNFCWK